MSATGMANTNGPNAIDRDLGKARAAQRHALHHHTTPPPDNDNDADDMPAPTPH
jgi:hypothetical protein